MGVIGLLNLQSKCNTKRTTDDPPIGSQAEHALSLFILRQTNFISDAVEFARNY